MRHRIVPSRWVRNNGGRLDCHPFLSGAVEARFTIESGSLSTQPLHELTEGYKGGIYNGPQFSRNYVDGSEHGVPFLGSSSMLRSELSNLPYLRRKDAESLKLSYLRLKAGTTLISCSGTIGRMVYARPDMEGMWTSQHIMKVEPDPEKILPGYLYAFLSSKFGVPLVTSGTYGAIIQHIEPAHIADLPVPRLGGGIEFEIAELISTAAAELDSFGQLLRSASKDLLSSFGLEDAARTAWNQDRRRIGWRQSSLSSETLRAMNFDPRAVEFWQAFEREKHDQLGSLCVPEFFKGKNIFKRIDAQPPHASMLVGQRTSFQIHPDGRWISTKSVEKQGLFAPEYSTLIPSHGTLGEFELYCRALIVTPRTQNYVFSGDFFRCFPKEGAIDPGYLFAFMRTEAAFRILRSISAGGKQQEQHRHLMWRFPVPRLDLKREKEIGDKVRQATASFDRAVECELEARKRLEKAVEEAA